MREEAKRADAVLVQTPALFHGGTQALFFDDVHPTAQGHAIIGRALARDLSARLAQTKR